MKDDHSVIASAARTPMGDLKSVGAAAMVLMKRSAAERRGIAALCIGGGEATAIALERLA